MTAADLERLPFVSTPPGCTVRQQLNGMAVNRVLEVQQLDTALQFVSQGLGVTANWRPDSFLSRRHPRISALQTA